MRDFNIDGVVVGRPYQEIYEQSETQKYPIGMIHERHGRRWRYSQAYEAITLAHRACPNMSLQGGDTGGSVFAIEHELHAVAKAGERSVLVHATPTYSEDYFFGGLMVVFSTGANPDIFCIRVSGNEIGDTHSIKIYLDEPLPVDCTAGAGTGYGVSVYPSPYKNVGNSSSCGANAPAVAVPSVKVTSGYYFWGQTKGPCWVTPTSYAYGMHKALVSDGCQQKAGTAETRQIIGYSMSKSSDGSYDDGVIMLHLE